VHGVVVDFVALGVALLVGAFFHFTFGALVRRALHALVQSTRFTWDDALADSRVLHRLVHLIPLAVVNACQRFIQLTPVVDRVVDRIVNVLFVFLCARILDATLDAAHAIYASNDERRTRPIRGYVQVARIFLWVATVVIGVAAAADKSPLLFLSGIGALTAVLLLVFKDTILGLVASVQLSGNDMIRVGDWIEMSSAGADGDVIDIALHTVKVQNWDKTITTVPTYTLISQGFKNWRSMGEAGGRRIKRAIVVENASIRHLTEEEIARLHGVEVIRD
jgi:miniconductance mechanosensitive channel